MRYISKRSEPASFAAWKARANDEWTPSFSVLQNPEKHELHLSLLIEQGFTCCYCGRSVDSTTSHIEHFRPQSSGQDELEYGNLLASCQRELQRDSPILCGHRKGEQFDEGSFLSPFDPAVERHFSYLLNGSIKANSPASLGMIEVLGLEQEFLTSRRSAALNAVFDPEFLDTVSRSELDQIASSFREFRSDGTLDDFFHVVARFAEDLP